MGKIAVKRLWSRHNVPLEIWSDILARLPVRSLVRFRCVSRSWKVLIDDPDFCQEHLLQFKNNRDETHLLMVQVSGAGTEHYVVRCSDTMKTSRRLGYIGMRDKKTRELKSTATPGFSGYWSVWFSVDGLYMLRCRVDKAKLMLWNPSIRQCRLVPHSHNTNNFLELGLGFDPLIKDYKLVRVSRSSAGSVEIYTVGTASWRTVAAAQGTVTSNWLQTAHQPVYCKGCLYIRSKTKLISFDLSREVFKSVDLPRYDNFLREQFRESFALVDGWSSLAVIHYSMFYGGSIWVLDNNAAELSWSMRCTFTMGVPHFFYLKKNGDLLFENIHRQVLSYNIHTEKERQTNCPKSTFQILSYKESLVLLN